MFLWPRNIHVSFSNKQKFVSLFENKFFCQNGNSIIRYTLNRRVLVSVVASQTNVFFSTFGKQPLTLSRRDRMERVSVFYFICQAFEVLFG